jgi:hypothetical protein
MKVKKYAKALDQINREIEALDGISKLNKLKTFHIGAVENCPVCNSSLLTNPNIILDNVERVNESNSLAFYKSEKSLYESYLKNSKELINRFGKTALYYEERIAEIKGMLSVLDKQLVEDSRMPSRIDIAQEIHLKFELEKMKKIRQSFHRFRHDLVEVANGLSAIRARKRELLANIKLDKDKIYAFQKTFVSYLTAFGYSDEILNRIYISLEESNKLFPVVSVSDMQAQPIRLMSSASDFIRAQWAFYINLLVKAKLHLGILILDEPGQHAMRSTDLTQLLKVASKIKNRQIIVAISKEEKIRQSPSNEGQTKQETQMDLQEILDNSGLKNDLDYTLNMIDGHNRIDKCIQPLDPKNLS